MADPTITTTNKDQLKIFYDKIYDAYQKVDDLRFKLLGLLPLASGLSILTLLNAEHKGLVARYLFEIGLFGVLITFGLLLYELKGIQKCTGFIYYGQVIEQQMQEGILTPVNGLFMGLSQPERGRYFFTEPVASAFVYATVLEAWVYVSSVQESQNKDYIGNVPLAAGIGLLVFAGVIVFWRLCAPPEAQREKEKPI